MLFFIMLGEEIIIPLVIRHVIDTSHLHCIILADDISLRFLHGIQCREERILELADERCLIDITFCIRIRLHETARCAFGCIRLLLELFLTDLALQFICSEEQFLVVVLLLAIRLQRLDLRVHFL